MEITNNPTKMKENTKNYLLDLIGVGVMIFMVYLLLNSVIAAFTHHKQLQNMKEDIFNLRSQVEYNEKQIEWNGDDISYLSDRINSIIDRL